MPAPVDLTFLLHRKNPPITDYYLFKYVTGFLVQRQEYIFIPREEEQRHLTFEVIICSVQGNDPNHFKLFVAHKPTDSSRDAAAAATSTTL